MNYVTNYLTCTAMMQNVKQQTKSSFFLCEALYCSSGATCKKKTTLEVVKEIFLKGLFIILIIFIIFFVFVSFSFIFLFFAILCRRRRVWAQFIPPEMNAISIPALAECLKRTFCILFDYFLYCVHFVLDCILLCIQLFQT